MSEELKACPFCGGEPTWKHVKGECWLLHCDSIYCGARPKISGRREDVIGLWNTRTKRHDQGEGEG